LFLQKKVSISKGVSVPKEISSGITGLLVESHGNAEA
jgi:hypothetical protein